MSTSSASTELDGLLSRLVDDQLDESASARLQAVLRADAAARRRYRQVMALHASLQWDYVAAARDAAEKTEPRQATGRWWLPWTSVAAAMLVAALTIVWWPSHAAPVLLTTSSLSGGTLTWSDGTTQRMLDAADGMPGGRLILEGESAVAVMRFSDDTTLTLTGDTEVAIEAPAGKSIDLRRGSLTADVTPQPSGQPMVVTTTTARVEVVGTTFTVGANGDTTSMTVEQGRVRLERLADQQAVEVASGQQTSVSFNAAKPIAVVTRPQIPSSWRSDFSQRPPSHWSGTWTAPENGSAGFFAATPYVAGRDANGRPIIHHGVRVEHPQTIKRTYVRLHSDSRLTMRFRLMRGDTRSQAKVMLCINRDNGSFGGTFFASINPQALPVDAEGWRTAVLAMSAFVPSRPTVYPSPVGHAVTFILANTSSHPAGLEVASLAIDQP